MPRKGEFCDTPNGRGKITDRNLLSRKVSVTFEGGGVSTFSVDDIKVCTAEKKNNSAPRKQNNRKNNKNGGDAGNERGDN